MADWSWDIEVPTSLERLLLVVLEDYSADEGFIKLKLERLQSLTGMSQNRLKQAANTLWQMGRLEFQPSRAGQPSSWHIIEGVCLTPSPPQTPPFPRVGFSFRETAPARGTISPREQVEDERPFKAEAHEMTRTWIGETTPRPVLAGGFPAAMKIVERFLEAGWTSDQVTAALREAPVCTLAALEFSLRRAHGQAQNFPARPDPPRPRQPEFYHPEDELTSEQRTDSKERMAKMRERLFGGSDEGV